MTERRSFPALLALIVLAAAAVGLAARQLIADARPTASERWAIYVERLKPEGKLVVLSAEHRYAASKEFTAKLLAMFDVMASIELSAWADVFYYVDVADFSRWSISWDPGSRSLDISAPEPDCLPPAVRTDTIEIAVKGGNILTNTLFGLKRKAAAMRDELSADLAVRARASLSDATVRAGVKEGIAEVGRGFCQAVYKAEPASVAVRLPRD